VAKITVYITCYNYEQYVERAIKSVLAQTEEDFELLIFDDGSTDKSRELIERFEDPRIKTFFQKNQGLTATSNNALKEARGKYIIRLDADDFFDENILLVLSNILDKKKEIDLVYPDYYEVNEKDETLGLVRRKKIGEETDLLDLPAHGACTMVRTAVLKELGGYNSSIKRQDGYDLWIRFIQEHSPYNVNLPLFYYRKHPNSSTSQSKKIIEARREIKKEFVKKGKKAKSLIIIPIRRESPIEKNLPLQKIGGKHLFEYALEAALGSSADRVVVVSEDQEVLDVAARDGVTTIKRSAALAAPGTRIEPTIKHVLAELEKEKFNPEIVAVQFYTSPLVKSEQLDEAIHTLQIFDTDTVLGVTENNRFHYVHNKHGLKPLFEKRPIKSEREFLYEESGAFIVSKQEVIGESMVGKQISHVVLAEEKASTLKTSIH
jgi:glycosyltransferase involved in cell wall biosynthesis